MTNGIQNAVALLSGGIFGVGLMVSGMADPANVRGFLNIAGDWNGMLMVVMASALLVSAMGNFIVTRMKRPILAPTFYTAARSAVDKPLVMGAVIFGAGWGVVGWCPGPVFVALGYGDSGALVFLGAMLVGMWAANRVGQSRWVVPA